MTGRAAFFDVDGTLITGTSLFRFLAYDLTARGLSPQEYDEMMAALGRLKAAGATREESNRAFFRAFAGRSVVELADRGERWFADECAARPLFDRRVLSRLREHAADGDLVVLLSGSFAPCVTPIARAVGAEVVVCTTPEVVAGAYTGSVAVPMVGRHKADGARTVAVAHDLDLAECWAYGDDVSDLPVLSAVGRPVAVGDLLAPVAAERGWAHLPSTPGG